MPDDLLARIEAYYDAVPRRFAGTEECGPFTLFLGEPGGWTYYARPRLDGAGSFTAADVSAAIERLQSLDLPGAVEWVHETTPALLPAARSAGLELEELPLLALDGRLAVTRPPLPPGITVRLLGFDDDDALSQATAVSQLAFAAEGTARGEDGPAERDARRKPASPRVLDLIAEGAVRIAVAEHESHGVLAQGRTLPVGAVTEVMGVATLPAARRQGLGAAVTAALVDDARELGLETVFLTASSAAVAAIYERIGFVPTATGWAAESPA